MSRVDRLRPLQEVNQAKLAEAASRLAMRQDALQQQQQRLLQLQQYRDEYGRDFQLHGETSRDPMWVINYQYFLAQLNRGIQQQQEVINECQQQLDRARESWTELKQSSMVLDKVVERLVSEERKHADKREQSQQDDRVQAPRSNGS